MSRIRSTMASLRRSRAVQPRLFGVRLASGLLLGLAACGTSSGCHPAPASSTQPPPTQVTTSRPMKRDITDYEEFTGRTEAPQDVEIRARVTGYLDKVFFAEGVEVKVNDPLFEIDRRPFQAAFDHTESTIALRGASLRFKKAEVIRNRPLAEKGAVSQSEFEQTLAAQDEADAAVRAAQADHENSKLNLEFTRINAPIAGRISRTNISPGNLVVADKTLLTTIVSVDPMYVYFNVDEQTILRVNEAIRNGKIRPFAGANEAEPEPGSSADESPNVEIQMGLGTDSGFPHRGILDFADNRVDASTGTIRVRGVFPNPVPKVGKRVLVPGLFTRVRVPIGAPHPAILVAERAIASDQGQKYVWVVNEKNEVEEPRLVALGKLEHGLRTIESGLNGDERVVVEGVQRVRPGKVVEVREVEMEHYEVREVGAASGSANRSTGPSDGTEKGAKDIVTAPQS